MLSRGLARSYQVAFYNEDNPAAFDQWRIKDFSTIQQLTETGYAQVKLFKPILDTHMAQKYLSHFGDSKVIFIFRHHFDVINSSIKRFGSDHWPSRVQRWIAHDFAEFASSPPPEHTKKPIRHHWREDLPSQSAIALYWYFYNRLYFDLDLHRNERVMLVKYEDVVTKPESTFRNLCDFTGIPYSSQMVDGIHASSVGRDNTPGITPPVQQECDRLWQKLCTAGEA